MTFLPIVERELRIAGRRANVHRNRILTPVLLAIVVIAKAFLVPFPTASAAQWGRTMLETMSALGLVFCALAGVRNTADCVSQERRDGTLGLLFLTDLKGYDVILGKLAASSIASIYALFAMVPILAWSLILGGVTAGEIARTALALIDILLFSLAAGVWVSSRSRSASRAMAGTLGLMLLFLLASVPLKGNVLAPISPAFAFLNASATRYGSHALGYWESLLLTPLFAWCFLARASITINRFREDESTEKRPSRGWSIWTPSPAAAGRRAKLRTQLIGVNPILWLASHNLGSRAPIWFLVLVTGTGIAVWTSISNSKGLFPATSWLGNIDLLFIGFIVVMNSSAKVLVASQACRCLAEARRNSTLEILLCSRLKVPEILEGQVLALKRTFLAPMLLLMMLEVIGFGSVLYKNSGGLSGTGQRFGDLALFGGVAFMIYFLLDLQGVAWAGIWFGLCSKNESRATFKTVFYVILLPLLMLVVYCLGYALFLAWPVASFVWARLKLQEHFRFLAGQRLTSSNETSGWLPFKLPEITEDQPVTELPEVESVGLVVTSPPPASKMKPIL
jgi:ABC-type transport system involved in multi-copper enzyme maturation permease subunit